MYRLKVFHYILKNTKNLNFEQSQCKFHFYFKKMSLRRKYLQLLRADDVIKSRDSYKLLMTVKPRPAIANSIFWRRKSSFIKQDIRNPIPAHPAVNMPAVIAALFR